MSLDSNQLLASNSRYYGYIAIVANLLIFLGALSIVVPILSCLAIRNGIHARQQLGNDQLRDRQHALQGILLGLLALGLFVAAWTIFLLSSGGG